jgi:hypothetical protein
MSANTPAIVNPSPASLASLAEVIKTAEIIVQSGLFPAFKTPQAAAALMLLCRSKGLDPMSAVERYHIVQGRPVMRADAMLAEFIQGGGRVEWHERTGEIASATFSHPQGGSVKVEWTLAMAKAAKLTGKDVWLQYPRQMLHARCVSEGVRSVFPGATNGLYTPEEAENMPPIAPRDMSEPIRASVTVAPASPAPAIEPKATALAPETEAAMQEFAAVAHGAGYGVAVLDSGKFSPRGSREAAVMVLGKGSEKNYNWTAPAPWELAKEKLVEKLAADAAPAPVEAAPAPAQPLKRTTPEPPIDDELSALEDPFADESEAPK